MNFYSEEYSKFLKRNENISALYEQIKNEFDGSKIFGEPINVNNPKEVTVLLYYLYKDYEQFHEPL